jgi:hypothetical protein
LYDALTHAPLLEPRFGAPGEPVLYASDPAFYRSRSEELLGEKYRDRNTPFVGLYRVQITVHKLITDVTLLSGFAAAIYGLALSRRYFALGSFWIGTGIGIGFMSSGHRSNN